MHGVLKICVSYCECRRPVDLLTDGALVNVYTNLWNRNWRHSYSGVASLLAMAEWYHWSWNVCVARFSFLNRLAFSAVKMTVFSERRRFPRCSSVVSYFDGRLTLLYVGAAAVRWASSWTSRNVAIQAAGEIFRRGLLKHWRTFWLSAMSLSSAPCPTEVAETELWTLETRSLFWPWSPRSSPTKAQLLKPMDCTNGVALNRVVMFQIYVPMRQSR